MDAAIVNVASVALHQSASLNQFEIHQVTLKLWSHQIIIRTLSALVPHTNDGLLAPITCRIVHNVPGCAHRYCRGHAIPMLGGLVGIVGDERRDRRHWRNGDLRRQELVEVMINRVLVLSLALSHAGMALWRHTISQRTRECGRADVRDRNSCNSNTIYRTKTEYFMMWVVFGGEI
jgi:hypothetical protein